MTNRKKASAIIPTIPSGYVTKRGGRQRAVPEERAGVTRWLIRAAADDREVVVVDALDADEAIQRAYLMRDALKSLSAWPAMPLIYAVPHGDGPVCITWFREGMFRALSDLQQPAT